MKFSLTEMRKTVGRTGLGAKIQRFLGLKYLLISEVKLCMQLLSLKFVVYVQVIYTNVEGGQSTGSI